MSQEVIKMVYYAYFRSTVIWNNILGKFRRQLENLQNAKEGN
jgi:hypothetical protein